VSLLVLVLVLVAAAHAGMVDMLITIHRAHDACVLLDDLLRISGILGVEGSAHTTIVHSKS
jgi:hypothetical protein